MDSDQIRVYDRGQSVVFLKTNEAFGGLSNMAGGYPLKVNGLRIFTSEALYQACRFPHMPEVQRIIIGQISPMTAKMKSKKYRPDSRPDWDQVRVKIMRWCLRVKLAQNWDKFSNLLLDTRDQPIVEHSHKDDFWGAKPIDEHTLVGMNVLGRLLMELREMVKTSDKDLLRRVEPLPIPEFLLDGRPIQVVSAIEHKKAEAIERGKPWVPVSKTALQEPLFGRPMKKSSAPSLTVNQSRVTAFADLKPYPEYKDSGVPWLGQIPAHWGLPRLGAVLQERGETNEHGEVQQVLSVMKDIGVIPYEEKGNVGNKKSEDITRYKIVRPDDIVVNCMNVIIGSVGLSRYVGCLSPVYYVLRRRLEHDDPRYLNLVFQTKPFQQSLVRIGNGILAHRMRIPMELLKCELLPRPPANEQAAIVHYLDHADLRIRRYITAKRKLITLLNEQKQAIIHRAVTRGLDPNVQLKPTGVAWLGDVPEHWEVRKLRSCGVIMGGMTPSMEQRDFWNGDIPWVTPKDMKRFEISDSLMRVSEIALEQTTLRKIPSGSILLVVRGMILARRVPIAIATAPVTINQDMKAIVPKLGVSSAFLAFAMNSAQDAFAQLIDEAGHGTRRLPTERWRELPIAFPPSIEQGLIVEHIGKTTATLDAAILRTQREIDLILEYRTRLIADVVTGKLDVRAAAANLPDEVAATESYVEALADEDAEMIEDADVVGVADTDE